MSPRPEDRFNLSPFAQSDVFSFEPVHNTIPPGGQIAEGLRRRPAPEGLVVQAGINLSSHVEPIARVRLAAILHPGGQVSPHGQPWRAGQVQRCGESRRVPVWEVEADENALPSRHKLTQGIPDHDLRLASRRRVLSADVPSGIEHADPDGILADARSVAGTPVNDDVAVEDHLCHHSPVSRRRHCGKQPTASDDLTVRGMSAHPVAGPSCIIQPVAQTLRRLILRDSA